MIELGVVRLEADLDRAQALAVSKLGERHGKELIPTGEVTDSVVAIVAIDTAREVVVRQMAHQLSKDSLTPVHNLSPAKQDSRE